MFLSTFKYFNEFFQTITQSFYIALSHINIRTRNKKSAGVLIIRERQRTAAGVIIIHAGGPAKNF